jgi:integrase
MSARATGYVRTIERRGGPVYYAKLKLPDGSQPQRRLGRVWAKRSKPPAGYLTSAMAEARLASILAGDDAAVNLSPSRVTFEAACEERLRYLEHDRKRKLSTITDYRNVVAHDLIPYFGAETPVENVTTENVEGLKALLLQRVSHRTAQKILVILHGIMARAKRKGWVTTNPCEDAEKVTLVPSDEFNILEPEQVAAVTRAAPDDTMGALFTVGAFTGLRCPGELIALRWEHIDFANRIVHVVRNFTRGTEGTTKGRRRRSVPLSDQAFVALDKLSRREHFTSPGDLVFCTVTGERLTGDAVRDGFYVALKAAGLNHLRYLEAPTDERPGVLRDDPIIPYDLRHTFGSLAVRKAPLSDVQAWMGHQDITTTMRYVHYVPQHDAAAKLTAAFAGETVHPTVHRTQDMHPELSATETT